MPVSLTGSVVTSTGLGVLCLMLGSATTEPVPMRIDAHIHLYDPDRPDGVPWPPANLEKLYRPHLPPHFHAVADATGISHAIVVEASPLIEDNDWLLEITAADPAFLGIVGNLDPRSPGFREDLERLAPNPRFLGIRPRLTPAPSLRDPAVTEALARVGELGLTLEFNVPEYPMSDVLAFARSHPGSRIVVTHLAGARLEGNRLSETWQREVRGFAGLPNTFCKLSAFYHASGTAVPPETAGTYAPLIEEIVSVFGDDRVLFGSNWPVSSLKGPYSPLPVIVREFARARGQDLEDAYFRRNTLRAYGLDAAGRREKGGNTVE